MQLSDATHDYDCGACGTTGGVCMEGLWMARRLAASIADRAALLPADFELVSRTRFTGCGRACAVDMRVTPTMVQITAGSMGARVEAEVRIPPRAALASG
ncbi:hypothetical protein [Rhodobaculum claviforme]|uniref:Uncharacterized protein n=1 Tax=Rhodobaculum claviforme TaxID=1549854 RepID=A0A934TIE2_9RHOB|nr:hypothetical protein [Rhodobaculum claviforme]MBK5926734.1 hypothetical protein [Rhodobaculum claviforme]